MNDLNLGPGAARVKCAKISGDTSGNYHPHGESVIYPTLVRMAQEWNMRHILVDKQGNFGSIAGLPAAAMRYTEARLESLAEAMMADVTDQDELESRRRREGVFFGASAFAAKTAVAGGQLIAGPLLDLAAIRPGASPSSVPAPLPCSRALCTPRLPNNGSQKI